jgi:hypothetical protein
VLIKRKNKEKLLIFSLFLIKLQTMKGNTCGAAVAVAVAHIKLCTRQIATQKTVTLCTAKRVF